MSQSNMKVGSAVYQARQLASAGDMAGAVTLLRSAASRFPRSGWLRIELVETLVRLRKFRDASDIYLEALEKGYGHAVIYNNLGVLLAREGRLEEARNAFAASLANEPQLLSARSNHLFLLNALPDLSADEIAREHFRYGAQFPARTFRMSISRAPGRLRIGYVASTFRRSSVTQFVMPILRAHDREKFEIFCYQANATADRVTLQARECVENWREIHLLTDTEAVSLIRADQIDVLVDLDGHTAENRLSIFALRGAPVQLTWLGYQNTTGLRQMDYRLTDSLADCPDFCDRFYTEELIRFDPPFVPFSPPEFAPNVSAPPALVNGFVTFGCFNQLMKLSDPVVRLFAEVLKAVNGSKLLLKSAALADEEIAAEQQNRFASCGVEPSRIMCRGLTEQKEHLMLYNTVDIALDTFPYHGVTTTCEALWMGLPVISLLGPPDRQRLCASLLQSAGFSQWISKTPQDFVAVAARLATDLEERIRLRRTMRESLLLSPLMDVARFTHRLEGLFTQFTYR